MGNVIGYVRNKAMDPRGGLMAEDTHTPSGTSSVVP